MQVQDRHTRQQAPPLRMRKNTATHATQNGDPRQGGLRDGVESAAALFVGTVLFAVGAVIAIEGLNRRGDRDAH